MALSADISFWRASGLSPHAAHPAAQRHASPGTEYGDSERQRHPPPELGSAAFHLRENISHPGIVEWNEEGKVLCPEDPVAGGWRLQKIRERPLHRREGSQEHRAKSGGPAPAAPAL